MKKSKFTEEQIVRILKEVEVGAKVVETCRKHGISEPTYYVWKSKVAGMEVSQLRHLKDIEAELLRLKRMYANLALEHHALNNAYIERFNRTFRTEVLDRYVFTTLGEIRRMAEDWRHRYNHHRPHRSLGGLTPIHYAMALSPSTSTFE